MAIKWTAPCQSGHREPVLEEEVPWVSQTPCASRLVQLWKYKRQYFTHFVHLHTKDSQEPTLQPNYSKPLRKKSSKNVELTLSLLTSWNAKSPFIIELVFQLKLLRFLWSGGFIIFSSSFNGQFHDQPGRKPYACILCPQHAGASVVIL